MLGFVIRLQNDLHNIILILLKHLYIYIYASTQRWKLKEKNYQKINISYMQLLDLWITCIIFLFFMDSRCPLLSTYCSYKENNAITLHLHCNYNNLKFYRQFMWKTVRLGSSALGQYFTGRGYSCKSCRADQSYSSHR